jgi:hypothetical protein
MSINEISVHNISSNVEVAFVAGLASKVRGREEAAKPLGRMKDPAGGSPGNAQV